MSERFPFPTKLNPVWWLKNSDQPDNEWGGFWRNPLHNFGWYVAGCTDRWHWSFRKNAYDLRPEGGFYWNFLLQAWPPFVLPFVSYKSSKLEFYLGWRNGGAFGARVTLK